MQIMEVSWVITSNGGKLGNELGNASNADKLGNAGKLGTNR